MKDYKLRILVVDDEIIIARNLQQLLQSIGHTVLEVACTGEDAIEKSALVKPDLIFMDIRLAGKMDGIEAAQEIYKRFAIPVIFVTAYADEATLDRAKGLAPYGYLVKPVSERDIKIITDIAVGRHRAEKKLKQISGKLEALVQERTAEIAKKVDELSLANADLERFAYVASHDLQEPLRMVSNYCQLLIDEEDKNLSSDGKEYLRFAVEGSVRMKAIVDDLLEYSRVGHMVVEGREPVDFNEVIHIVINILGKTVAEAKAVFRYEDLPTVYANKNMCIRLMQNLISNSLKFRKRNESCEIDVRATKKDEVVQFSVADKGIGIEPTHFEKVFVIFQRLHSRESFSGSGIGLAICKRIVEAHQGRIWLESIPDQGTTFHFTLSS